MIPSGSGEKLKALQRTIDHAFENAAFYRSRWAGIDRRMRSLEDLARLPLLTKRDANDCTDSLQTDSRMPQTIVFSGGTTGDYSMCSRSLVEAKLNAERNEALARALAMDRRPLGLCLAEPLANIPYQVPGWSNLYIPILMPKHARLAQQLLDREFRWSDRESRLSFIMGSTERVHVLTRALIEAGASAERWHIGHVHVSASRLRRSTERLLAAFWQAKVIEHYGLSECPNIIFSRCEHCGSFHDSPFGIAELIDPFSEDPVERGPGRLVLTCLYPHVQQQPMIRYLTGDIFEIVGRCDATGSVCWQFLGRAQHCAIVRPPTGSPIVLGAADVDDVCDDHPDVAVEPSPFAAWLDDGARIGHFRWSFDCDGTDIRVDVGIGSEKDASPREDARVTSSIRAALLERCRPLAEAVNLGTATLTVASGRPSACATIV